MTKKDSANIVIYGSRELNKFCIKKEKTIEEIVKLNGSQMVKF